MMLTLNHNSGLRNETGSSLIYALLFIMIVGYMGTALINISSAEDVNSSNSIQTSRNLYIGHAGLELASAFVKSGENLDNAQRDFEGGHFGVYTNPQEGLVTVPSTFGSAAKLQSIKLNFAEQCVHFDTTQAVISDKHLSGVRVSLDCAGQQANVTSIGLDWDLMPRLATANTGCTPNAPAGTNYSNFADIDVAGNILICHVPRENPAWAETESVTLEQWKYSHHEGQGAHDMDYLGACSPETTQQMLGAIGCYTDGLDSGAAPTERDPQYTEAQHSGGYQVTHIIATSESMQGSETFYDSMDSGSSPHFGANPNQPISNGHNNPMQSQTNYFLDFTFAPASDTITQNGPPSGPVTFIITVTFADGSLRSYSFSVNP